MGIFNSIIYIGKPLIIQSVIVKEMLIILNLFLSLNELIVYDAHFDPKF